MTDYYANMYFDDPKAVENTVEDDDFDENSVESLIELYGEGRTAPARVPDVEDWEDV